MPNTANFADRLLGRITALDSPVCVGLDPVLDQLPAYIRAAAAQSCGQTEAGAAWAIEQFSCLVIDAVADVVPIVKPQSAFFEIYGGAGVQAFWSVVAYARQKGLLVLADAKRGDIGSTAAAYAQGFLGRANPWSDPQRHADALTVNPYLGRDGLVPFINMAKESGRGVFVLVKTSNPSAGELQDQILKSGETVARRMAGLVAELGEDSVGGLGYSMVGAVVGATYPADLAALRGRMPRTIFLVPGYGAQGGRPADVIRAFNSDGLGAIISASRSVIYAFPPDTRDPGEIKAAVRSAAQQMNTDLRRAFIGDSATRPC